MIQTLGCSPIVGSPRSSYVPPSLGRVRVVPPPPPTSYILKTESNFFKRLTVESWFILSRPKVINRSDGESFPVVYRSLL